MNLSKTLGLIIWSMVAVSTAVLLYTLLGSGQPWYIAVSIGVVSGAFANVCLGSAKLEGFLK